MSNIDRRYAYLDEGVFPAEGEYGVTYLTLYSSNAGNVYDGWVYDPDNKIEESSIPRTYGYRNPDYQQYCWDDEVVVDLSNAQNRQESSESVQGRITSFNTNVSDQPIILQDIDITGLTEEERENKATVVLFSAIPIVKDAYIQAQIEVQCKCNLSPDNTSGEMRIEAFYILNDESDRTMRPNPVHTFTVSSPNERHTLPWIYWNPALKHEDHNYIGVKLIATGGTAEIGISDDPDYGDAIITLASGGLNGDIIYSGHPVSLEIFGKDYVPGGYRLNVDDYTVLCTYDTGEIYEVTKMCNFIPSIGTKITDPVTVLTAEYQGLMASMYLYLALVTSIELNGLTDIYEAYKLNLNDYFVLAYYDTGDVMDISGDNQLSFSPSMGTIINQNTTLVATYEPEYMPGSSFSDTLEITKHVLDISVQEGGLIYSLYDDNTVVITGNAKHIESDRDLWGGYYEYIETPAEILSRILEKGSTTYKLEWDATGPISGICLRADTFGVYVSKFINFDSIQIKPRYFNRGSTVHDDQLNPIILNFYDQKYLTLNDLIFLYNIDFSYVDNVPNVITSLMHIGIDSQDSQDTDCDYMFCGCENLNGISFMRNWDMSKVTGTSFMFERCKNLHSALELRNLNLYNVKNASYMFSESGLMSFNGMSNLMIGKDSSSYEVDLRGMFGGCPVQSLSGLEYLIVNKNHEYNISSMFSSCEDLWEMDAIDTWRYSKISNISYLFYGCKNLQDIHCLSGWDASDFDNASAAFCDTKLQSAYQVSFWNIPAKTILIKGVFGTDVEIEPPYVPIPKPISIPDCSSLENWYNSENDYTKYFQTERKKDSVTGEYYTRIKEYRTGDSTLDDEGWYSISFTTGMFEGIDIYGIRVNDEVNIQDPDYPIWSIIFKFKNGNKLPNWYKQLIVDDLVNLYSNHIYYHGSLHNFTGYLAN